ncbi:hypothetical protein BDZ45DRAFT_382189 [Acephala macrosclerotiorum]|nr:hypothetical protein BDZ45DRAFT_382189 [Acephala macrosclerotiorum]
MARLGRDPGSNARDKFLDRPPGQYAPMSLGYISRLQSVGKKLEPYINPSGWDDTRHGQIFWQKVNMKASKTGLGFPPFHLSRFGTHARRQRRAWQSILDDHNQAAYIWKSADSDTQMKIFGSQLRSAKIPKALMHEMAKLCAEIYEETDTVLLELTKKIHVEPLPAFSIPWEVLPEDKSGPLMSFGS